ncbi:MAG: trypsin-like peptidase domain-containing protein [Candidatus Pacebacteria bacterium]|nr:trypsin-like peptidase domain-containing protein [Candidatus Paceibacterota bacterium]MDD2757150.1 trypsin-like peptidase domain-containing protein [Candidatus Paceibacterota bacterium]MDD3283678.1 trypsin-like peptidase domain-containing protein [Candidatus Paceibacterota bacterium]MDD3969698.1 trypsin-like peptidase domain-containing protein [Candidatus Paceibacterota bacterium]MDD4737706.1 trypsin-like peptidase domain-containing protein [Candidatus Paceibacterota bacterium]
MYELPEFNIKKKESKPFKGWFLIIVFLLGLLGGASASYIFYLKLKQEIINAGVPIIHSERVVEIEKEYIPQTTQEQKIIDVVKENSPSVVSVVAYKDMPVYEQSYSQDFFFIIPRLEQKGTERQQVGAGTGFIVSEDGLILTNKHVVSDVDAEYVVVMTDNKEYNAKVLARDPVQDLAIMKIEGGNNLKPLRLGNVDDIQIGQTVIAIGNALGRFQNTVSVGVVSGLGRTIVATGTDSTTERLEDIIQTDTAINRGNSGGPLINLKGEVVGINTAISTEGQGIGFAISIDKAKRSIEQVKTIGKISYPYMGLRYVILDKEVSKARSADVDYGALVVGDNDSAVIKDSPAEEAGIKEGDIILEMNGEKVTKDNSLARIISKYNPFEKVNLKVLRDGQEIYLNIVLGEWKE